MNMIFIITIVLQCILILVGADPTLEQQNINHRLNPLNEDNYMFNKEHDKRTIFNSGIRNLGWAKHIGQNPSGVRYVIGYSPVDYKYIPVVRPPIKIVNHRPRWPLKIVRPIVPIRPIQDHGWRPIQTLVKPVVPVRPLLPVVKPVIPISAQPSQWPHQQTQWKPKPTSPPTTVQVVPVQPIVKPLPPPLPPQVISVQPVQQFIPTHQLLPAHQVPNPWVPSVKPAYPLVPTQQGLPVSNPVVPSFKPAYPLVPQFFGVAKPNLPVIPLGSRFPTTIFQQVPTGPGVILQKPQVVPHNPGTFVAYHVTHNVIPANGVINIPKVASFIPQFSQSFPHPPPPVIQSPGVQIQVHSQQPHENGQTIPYPSNHQLLPHAAHIQQIPQQEQQIPQQEHQLVDQQYLPPLAHGQLPLEGKNGANQEFQEQQHQFSSSIFSTAQGQSYYDANQAQQEQYQSSNVIQPGQTDVQTPLYLPPHPSFNTQVENINDGFQNQFSPSQDDGMNGFRPSPVLESPFNNFNFGRREFVVQSENVKSNGTKNDHD